MNIKDREKVLNKFGCRCAYCGKEITLKTMQVDHYWPKCSPGVAKTFGFDVNCESNLMPSCRSCNHYKRGELPKNWRENMKTIHERIKKIYIAKVALDFGIVEIKPFDGIFYFEKLTQK